MDHHLLLGLAAAFVLAAIGLQLLWQGGWDKPRVRTGLLRAVFCFLSGGTDIPGLATLMLFAMAITGAVTALLGDPFYVAFRNVLIPPLLALALRSIPLFLPAFLLGRSRDR